MNEEVIDQRMSRGHAIEVILKMMKRKDATVEECDALSMCARAIFKRHLSSSKNWARRRESENVKG